MKLTEETTKWKSASLLFFIEWISVGGAVPESDLAIKQLVICFGAGIVACIRLLYAELFRRTYQYQIRGLNLVITKGIFLKETVKIPVSRITEVYLKRTFGDFLLGLSNPMFS